MLDANGMNKVLKQTLLLAAIICLSIVILVELKGFLNGVLGALAIYIVLRKPYFILINKYRWNKYLASLMITGGSALVILAPLIGIGALFKNQFELILENYTAIVTNIEFMLQWIEGKIGFQILSQEATQRMAADLAQRIPDLLSSTAGTIMVLLFMFFMLYVFLLESEVFEREVRKLLPFQTKNNDLLLKELRRMTISNVVGIPLIAIVQGVTALIAYLIAGAPDPFLWAVLTGMASVIPVVGTALVWGPLGLYLLAAHGMWQGLFVLMYGMFIVTSIDNLARMVLQKVMADIHPLITIIGVIIGINIFGFIGLIFGPLIVSYLFLLVRIYKNEFVEA